MFWEWIIVRMKNAVSSSIIFTENEVDNFFDKESSNYSSSDDDDE